MPLTFIIISDIIPIKQRSIFISMLGIIFGVSSILGPLIGGAFTDQITWRWSFYINIPICVFAICMIQLFLNLLIKYQSIGEELKRVDYLGSITLALDSIALVLALNWGGKEYSWSSIAVLVPLIVAFLFYSAFVVVELKHAIEPIIPSRILNRQVISVNLTSFFNGFLFIASIYYLPLYYQVVYGYSATFAGLELLPLLLGEVTVAISSGFLFLKQEYVGPLIL